LFEQQAERTPHSLALVFDDQQLTYAELNARSNQLAHHLIELGIGPDKIVAVCLERSVELIVSLLAVIKAGGAYLPLDPAWPEKRLQTLLKASGACVVIVDPTTPTMFTNAPVGLRSLNIYSLAKAARSIDINPQDVSPDSLAYLLFTSGSTGSPKGVLIEHRALVHRVIGLRWLLSLHPSSRVLALTASVFDISLLELVVPLTCGGLIVVANEQQRRDPSSIEKLLTRHQISLLQATPSMLFNLVDSAGLANSDLTILAGGEELPEPLANRLSKVCGRLLNGYGPTEATIYTSLAKVDVGNGISIGHPIAGTTVRILNSAGQLCPIGIPGELHIGGVGLARGYLNNPELTAEKFIPDPFSSDPTSRLYKSGDLASWNPDGTIAFHGRIDQQIKLRGYRIEPGEIESHVLAHPVIAQAAVVLHSTDPADPRLIAYWVAQTTDDSSSAIPSAEQLRSFLAERLPAYMVPSAFVALDELPLTTTGKLDRKALPAPTFAADPEQRVEPSTDLEHKLHAIWAEVLGHADFGITDNFFLVGGNSLASARLVSRINREVKLSDSLISFFKDPTIAGQVNIISGSVRDPYRCLVTLQLLGQKQPIFIIHGWAGKVSQWRHLAGALAPHRPVFGLQAYGADHDLPPQGNLEEMADAYADEILQQQREGKINLLGHSTGGWYAFAVAGALLKRGASIGMLAVLDTKPPWPKIHLSRDPFTALLGRYIPCKLSVHIDILAPASQLSFLQIFWSAYAL
jgi:amino acid adenylation domain-containing protein